MRALVLAAHGSSKRGAACAGVRRLEEVLRQDDRFDEVVAAFHRSQPSWSQVLGSLHSEEVAVVPMMAGSGYFCNTVLPQEMGAIDASIERDGRVVRVTPPLGSHSEMAPLIARLVSQRLDRLGWAAQQTALVIVGHGTERHPKSGDTTGAHACALKALLPLGDVAAVFLDQQPLIETAFELLNQSQLVVVPFMIGGGPHAVNDIPARLGLSIGECGGTSVLAIGDGRRLSIVPSPFEESAMKDFVLELAEAAFDDRAVSV